MAAPRATWVWDRPHPRDLVSWVRGRGVTELFVAVRAGPQSPAELAWLRSVVERAHAHGMSVAALGGDKGWVDDTAPALAWLRAVSAMRLFDGVHLDVEVWDHDEWEERPGELGSAFVELLRQLREATPLRLEADIAFHLHTVSTSPGESLESAVMRVVDAVTVLSYRNTVSGPDSITDVARSAVTAASRRGVPCRLAVETKDLGPDPVARKQTFHGLGQDALDRALTEVDRRLADVAAYRGVAVHDVEHWRRL